MTDEITLKRDLEIHNRSHLETNSNLKPEEIDKILQGQKLIKLLEEGIKDLEKSINDEENNIINVTQGFKEYTYKLIQRLKSEKEILEKLLEESKK